ncbi:hypothetical protein ACS3SW_10825 [Roseobacteraceae bacterium S113]
MFRRLNALKGVYRAGIGAASLALLAASADAAPVSYDCNIGNNGADNWISERFILAYDVDTKIAAVSDRVALIFNNDKPQPAEVDRETRNGVIIKWFIETRSASGQNAKFRYSANLNTKTGKVTVVGVPLGYANRFTGGGRCKLIKPGS